MIVAFVICNAYPPIQRAKNLLMFMLGLLAMDAEGDQDFDVTIGNPLTIKPIYQQREV